MGIAVVTGSASGIGAAVRARLEKNGDRVIGIDLRNAEIEVDLSTPEGRKRSIAQALEACGGGLDRLVVAAGLGAHVSDVLKIASVNYFGAVEVLDGLRGAMEGREAAAAVAICSNSAPAADRTSGSTSQLIPFDDHPFVLALLEHDEPAALALLDERKGFIAYGGSKHALSRAVRRRAKEWGAIGVRLNGIAPGVTRTPLMDGAVKHPVFGKGVDALDIPLDRWAEPDEIAGVINFLLGPEASYVHGSIVYVDGANRPDRF